MKKAMCLLVLLFALLSVIAQASASSANTGPIAESHQDQISTGAQVVAIAISSITAVIGLVIGWAIFPLTIAPITYIMRSELDIWGARLAMALIGGICGFIFPYGFLVKTFSS
jgi:hypothetical protein